MNALNIWITNIIVCALALETRPGRAAQAREGQSRAPDLLFPQMTDDQLSIGWRPTYIDSLFASFTNATTFFPTDTLPLSPNAKLIWFLAEVRSRPARFSDAL